MAAVNQPLSNLAQLSPPPSPHPPARDPIPWRSLKCPPAPRRNSAASASGAGPASLQVSQRCPETGGLSAGPRPRHAEPCPPRPQDPGSRTIGRRREEGRQAGLGPRGAWEPSGSGSVCREGVLRSDRGSQRRASSGRVEGSEAHPTRRELAEAGKLRAFPHGGSGRWGRPLPPATGLVQGTGVGGF